MSVNQAKVNVTPQAAWDVLADGWLYPLWVVGATRMRDVDPGWPEVGSKLHHSAGVWPWVVNDETEVLVCEPTRRLQLQARGWPFGEAAVTITLEPEGEGTRLELQEEVSQGPGRLLPQPVRQPLLAWRNSETLRRLGFVIEGRHSRNP